MRFKRKIPSFVFGVSIGLLVGAAFFVFKIDSYLKKFNKPSIDNIKVVEQVITPINDVKSESKSNKKNGVNTNKSPNINYNEVDALLNEGDLSVEKEELLSVKNINVINIDGNAKQDTLTGQLAGITDNKYPNLFFVEFWKTPLNSKGYRMTRNRVVLYGISDFANITIYKVDDNYYLKNDDVVYKISVGIDFKPMELVNDNDLLAKIN